MAGAAPFRFTCACCGKLVEGLPDLAFDWPAYYGYLPEAERTTRARLGSDLCMIDDKDFFIRVICPIPIQGSDESFAWGVWVSLSEANFRRYEASYDEPEQSKLGGMFGWFSNRLPGYPDTLNLQTTVWPQDGNQRPQIFINEACADHPLYVEQTQGMSLERLGEIYATQICDENKR